MTTDQGAVVTNGELAMTLYKAMANKNVWTADQEIRLKCLELAGLHAMTSGCGDLFTDDIVIRARAYADFVRDTRDAEILRAAGALAATVAPVAPMRAFAPAATDRPAGGAAPTPEAGSADAPRQGQKAGPAGDPASPEGRSDGRDAAQERLRLEALRKLMQHPDGFPDCCIVSVPGLGPCLCLTGIPVAPMRAFAPAATDQPAGGAAPTPDATAVALLKATADKGAWTPDQRRA